MFLNFSKIGAIMSTKNHFMQQLYCYNATTLNLYKKAINAIHPYSSYDTIEFYSIPAKQTIDQAVLKLKQGNQAFN